MDSKKDVSQPVKADGAIVGAQPVEPAPERPATQTGPKASDIPADSIVQSGQEAGTRNEYSLNQQDLVRVLCAHFGTDFRTGQYELMWNDASLGGLKLIHST